MGKRSDFERVPKDYYPTPLAAVVPLIPHLPKIFTYVEPCAGDGRLVGHISKLTDQRGSCWLAFDVEPRSPSVQHKNVFGQEYHKWVDFYITNPPWSRDILHPLIEHLSAMAPTWLLFDADWMHTKQSSPYMEYCCKVVSIGRVKWIEDSKQTGKDNACWYLFDSVNKPSETIFVGR